MGDWWQYLTTAAWRLLEQHGQLAAFLFLLIEEAGTPVPVPGDFIMVLAGERAARGQMNLLEALLVMELATVLGASTLYWLSARAGRQVVYRLGRHIGLTPVRLDRMAHELHRRGWRAVFIGRLTPGLRMITPVACGVFRFPFRVYLPAMAAGAFLYLLFYTLLGFYFGPPVLDFLESIELPLGLLFSMLLLAVLTVWIWRVRRRMHVRPRQNVLRERLWTGAACGLVATLFSSVLVHVLIHILGLVSVRAPGAALARLILILSNEIVRTPGLAVASLFVPAVLVVGAALGAGFGGWLGNSVWRGGLWMGLVYALLPLAISLMVVLPLLGAGPLGLHLEAGFVPAIGETLRHLAYGAILGTLYPALATPRSQQADERAAHSPPDTSLHPAAT